MSESDEPAQTNTTPPTHGVRELVLTDSFHRLKRTAVLLSTALIVLGLAQLPDPAVFKLAWTDVSLSAQWVQTLLSIGALYYAWGFWLEVQAAVQRNSQALKSDDNASIDRMIERIRQNSEPIVDDIETMRSELSSILDGVRNDYKLAEDHVESIRTHTKKYITEALEKVRDAERSPAARVGKSHADIDELASTTTTRIFHEMLHGPAQRFGMSTPREATTSLVTSFASWTKRSRETLASLQDLQSSLRRLAPDLVRQNKISFWGFEVAGVAAPLALGLALTWGPYAWEPLLDARAAREAAAIAAEAAGDATQPPAATASAP